MRIVRINPLPNLSPRQREMAIQQGWWPGEEEAAGFRVYETADGDAVIAPWNPAIRPGMKVVAEGSIHGAFTVPAVERSGDERTAVGRAEALVPMER